jgi:hypothetical protein
VYGYAGEDNEEDWMGYANGFPGISLIVFKFQVHDLACCEQNSVYERPAFDFVFDSSG